MAATGISGHLAVAFRLAKRDANAADDIGNDIHTFWYSFQAALVTLPFLLVTIFFGAENPIGLFDVMGDVALFAVGWLLFPVVMLEVAPAIGKAQHYFRYIATSNWCNVLEDGLLALILILRTLDIIPGSFGGLLFFGAVVWVFSFQFFVARNVLKLDAGGAAMIVGLRLMLALALFFAKSIVGG